MTGIVTNENSFYMRTTLYPKTPRRLLELFETPSQWLTADWLDAQHMPTTGPFANPQQLRCVWRDGASVVTFELAQIARGAFRLDVSLEPARDAADIGSIANACAAAKQRLRQQVDQEISQ